MDKYAKLREQLKDICGGSGGGVVLLQGKVVRVDGDSCSILLGDLELSDVRLRATVGETGEGLLLVTPVVGSVVLVGSLTGDYRDLAVLSVDQFSEISLGGSTFGGLVKVTELVKRLNAIEGDINKLKDVMNSWIPVPCVSGAPTGDGGTALKTAAASWFGDKLKTSTQTDIENSKITHG